MPLQLRLLLSFAAFVVLAGGLGVLGLTAASRMAALAIATYDQPLMTINYAQAAALKFARLRGLETPPGADVLADIEGDLEVVVERAGQAQARTLVLEAQAAVRSWLTGHSSGGDPAAIKLAADKAEDAMTALVEFAEETGYRFRSNAKTSSSELLRIMIGAIVATVLAGGLLAVLLARRIVRPLRQAILAIERVTTGDLASPLPVVRTGRDETTTLLRAISGFRDNALAMQEMVAEKARRDDQEAQRRSQEIETVAAAFEATMQQIIHRVTAGAALITEHSQTVAADADASRQESAIVSSAVEQTTASIRTLAATVTQFAEAIAEVTRDVTRAKEVTGEASGKAKAANEAVLGLVASAHRINDVTQTIHAIAKQTNMLALNATIEAARAGAAGKGFAVVAAEVKSLATQTSQATSEITAMIAAIETASARTVTAIADIVSIIGDVEVIAGSIAGSISIQQTATDEINENVHQLAQASEEVARNIVRVSANSYSTSQAAATMVEATVDLGARSDELEHASDHFLTRLRRNAITAATILLVLTSWVTVSHAEDEAEAEVVWPPPIDRFDSGKLLATSGVTQIEGAAGGGLVPWAVIGGYGTRDAIGANAHYSFVGLPSFQLHSAGMTIGLFDRLELSYSRLSFDTMGTGTKLGIGKGYRFEQDVIGAKLRLFGDIVYDQDRLMPQIAVGAQYKISRDTKVLRAIGAKRDSDVDVYLSATKLVLDYSLLLNATVRLTRANQLGILGFGGDRSDAYAPQFEGSAAYFLQKDLAVGAEFRMKPDNLRFAREQNAYDLFVAYFLNKSASLTLAYLDLGSVANQSRQNGVYASLQIGF
jgi:methyl-accepting chemotaxis protein